MQADHHHHQQQYQRERKEDEMKNNHTSRIHIVYLPYCRFKTILKLTIKFNSITLFEREKKEKIAQAKESNAM